MKYFLIAGEASGDLHGANLMRELKKADEKAQFCFLGGDLMAAEGGKPVIHYRQMAFMGITAVILHLRTVLGNMKRCRSALQQFAPDALILIDYPSFNLRMAKFAKKRLHIPVFYYISPKLWAWKEYRIKDIKACIDHLFAIFPFEVDFYHKHNYQAVTYVGNPTLDAVDERPERDESKSAFCRRNALTGKPLVALLSGSRYKEIEHNLPYMVKASKQFPDFQFVVAGAPGISPDYYDRFLSDSDVKVVFGQTYALLQHASAALVTSGTATLETALLNVPQTVVYKANPGWLIVWIYNVWIRIPYFSLVNIIAGRDIVVELLGNQVTTDHLTNELNRMLYDDNYRQTMLTGYAQVHQQLGKTGASAQAAQGIIEQIAAQPEGHNLQ